MNGDIDNQEDKRVKPLNKEGVELLLEVGFTAWEIKRFNDSVKPINLSSETWLTAMETRMNLRRVDALAFEEAWGRTPTEKEIDTIIHNWYHEHLINDPWIWIQLAYKAQQAKVDWERYVDKAHARAVRITRDIRTGDIEDLTEGVPKRRKLLLKKSNKGMIEEEED